MDDIAKDLQKGAMSHLANLSTWADTQIKKKTQKIAAITLDIEKGDILLGGRFKNKRTVVKDIGTDELGQPTINKKKLLTFRIEKELPEDKKSRKTQAENLKDQSDSSK